MKSGGLVLRTALILALLSPLAMAGSHFEPELDYELYQELREDACKTNPPKVGDSMASELAMYVELFERKIAEHLELAGANVFETYINGYLDTLRVVKDEKTSLDDDSDAYPHAETGDDLVPEEDTLGKPALSAEPVESMELEEESHFSHHSEDKVADPVEPSTGESLRHAVDRILATQGKSLSDLSDAASARSFMEEIAVCASQNPYLLDFLKQLWESPEVAKESYKIYKDEEKSRMLTQAVAYAFVLDRLTTAVRYEPEVLELFKKAYNDHISSIMKDEFFKELGLGALGDSLLTKINFFDFLNKNHMVAPLHTNTFEKVKKFGIDLAIDGILGYYKKGNMEGNGMRRGLPINIIEAILEDYRLSNFDNGDAGIPMITGGVELLTCGATASQPSRMSDDGKAMWMYPILPKQFADLYSTWNMAFVSHYPTAPMFYGKLFNPRVLCYEDHPQEYLHNRIVALWLHIYYELFNRVKRGSRTPEVDWNDETITALWSKVNKANSLEYETDKDRCLIECPEPKIADIEWMEGKVHEIRSVFKNNADRLLAQADELQLLVHKKLAERDVMNGNFATLRGQTLLHDRIYGIGRDDLLDTMLKRVPSKDLDSLLFKDGWKKNRVHYDVEAASPRGKGDDN